MQGRSRVLAGLRVEGVVSASLVGLPDDLWRQICAHSGNRRRAGARSSSPRAEARRSMNTGVGFDKLVPMLHLHYLTKILTSIGLGREAPGVQLECRADVLKKMMFMIQAHVRKLLQKGS